MRLDTIKVFLYNINDKEDTIMDYIKKNKCNFNRKEYTNYYTSDGKMTRRSNEIKKIKIYEDNEMNMKITSILKENKLNEFFICDCSYEKLHENIYNFPEICFEIFETQMIYFLNDDINYIIQKEYGNEKLINTSNYFEIKSDKFIENINFLKSI
tara:strand:+ start:213 stop:677 length:465 start_codon:yes stop_codon:yes gene_type:complete